MQEDTKVLDEVVITGFGMAQKKATLTGAVSAIKSTDIERSAASTASGALVGKIAGLNTRMQDGRLVLLLHCRFVIWVPRYL